MKNYLMKERGDYMQNDHTSTNDDREEMVFLSTKDVAEALDCSLPTARKIMRHPSFPLIRVGKNMRVSKSAFLKWAETRRI